MKPGDLVRLKSGSKHTPYSHGEVLEVIERPGAPLGPIAHVRWGNGNETEEILRDFVHYYEVICGG